MIKFTATLLQFQEQGEKTGWTYIQVPLAMAQQLKPGNKKVFRVKGKLDISKSTSCFDAHRAMEVLLCPLTPPCEKAPASGKAL
jgi:hypothetical protein